MVTLFVISTLEGWPNYIYELVDGASENTGPILNNNPIVYLYFVLFIMFGSVISVNLFVAIISMNFQDA